MAKLIRPTLFSKKFGIAPKTLAAEGFIDPILNADTKLFIDPLLLEESSHPKIQTDAFELLKKRFGNVISLVKASKTEGDVAWRSAAKILDLSETAETCLGYGGASTSGNSRPDSLKRTMLHTAREIVELGENDPQIISLMGLLEEGVGADTISDLTTNLIMSVLAEITEDFCKRHKVTVKPFFLYDNRSLPENPFRSGVPVLLVPKDILRVLPIANDRSEVSRVIAENAKIREAVNGLFGNITKATVTQWKHAIRKTMLGSLDNFKELFNSLLNSGAPYDSEEDFYGHYMLREILASDRAAYAGKIAPQSAKTKAELLRIVNEIIENFRIKVEENNLWELLWHDDEQRHERTAQLLFFGIADAFCEANNIDISPETHPGGGPVDFKFSTGYENRLIVEVKLSTGKVVHGYKTQLEIYKSASRTDAGILLVIDVGKMGKKLETIQRLQREERLAGRVASEIALVDGTHKKSASHR
jgi:hypothetical protein